jgi:hypothetical protein
VAVLVCPLVYLIFLELGAAFQSGAEHTHNLCYVITGATVVLKHHTKPVIITCTCRYGVCTGMVLQVTGVVLPVRPMVLLTLKVCCLCVDIDSGDVVSLGARVVPHNCFSFLQHDGFFDLHY